MGLYRERVLPHLVDRVCGAPGVATWRSEVVAGLHGDVVEIGFGSGLNVPHYPAQVRRVYAVEPALLARRLAEPRISASHAEVVHVGLDGARLDLPDQCADAALSTFTLCTIPDVAAALAQLRRVLRPGGTLHVLEHGLSPDPPVAAAQRLLEPVQRRVADGCHLTREPLALLSDAGFTVRSASTRYGGVPTPWNFLTLAVAAV
jgi:ubiquinone/menaquinone biosynthesis C-methylase UbiE